MLIKTEHPSWSVRHLGLYRMLYVSMITGNVMDRYQSIAWELGLPAERSRATACRAIRSEITRQVQEARPLPVRCHSTDDRSGSMTVGRRLDIIAAL